MIQMKNDNRRVIKAEDKVSKFCWSTGLVERLIYGKDGAARGAVVRVSKRCREISRGKINCKLSKLVKIRKKRLMILLKLL